MQGIIQEQKDDNVYGCARMLGKKQKGTDRKEHCGGEREGVECHD